MIQAIPGIIELILTLLGAAQAGKWALRSKKIGGAVAKVAPKVVDWARRGGTAGRATSKAAEAVASNRFTVPGIGVGAPGTPALGEATRSLGRRVRGVLQQYPVASPTLAALVAATLGRGAGQGDKQQALEMINQMQGLDGGEDPKALRAALLMQLLEQANMNRGG